MIEVKNLKKSYNEVKALSGVSFSVKPGEIIGLLGPNGAGKTTIMKILTGFLHPTAGEAKIGGFDVLQDTASVQAMIGYLPENAPLYPELTVQSHLKMMADLRKIPQGEQIRKISKAVHAVGLENRLTRPVGTLSKGFRQRVGLAQAILHDPRLLILDEPTNGLDPTQIAEVRRLIGNLAHRSTVMVSTHILSEVEATCDRAIIIMNGRVKADAKLSELAATSDAILILGNDHSPEKIQQILTEQPGVEKTEIVHRSVTRTTYHIHGNSDQDICPSIYQLARHHDWPLCELKKEILTLEAVFNKLASGNGGAQ